MCVAPKMLQTSVHCNNTMFLLRSIVLFKHMNWRSGSRPGALISLLKLGFWCALWEHSYLVCYLSVSVEVVYMQDTLSCNGRYFASQYNTIFFCHWTVEVFQHGCRFLFTCSREHRTCPLAVWKYPSCYKIMMQWCNSITFVICQFADRALEGSGE